jgi:DNA topoisomerase-1
VKETATGHTRRVPRLRRADCAQPGWSRRRHGRGFVYLDDAGRPIRDPEALDRLRSLAIPPAWQDVWICPHLNGHLQAVGTDAAGRRQYLYHPAWSARRSQEKFNRMVAFARSLPGLRASVAESLEDRSLRKQRVLACAVRLLDLGFFRVGGEEYADGNGSYGLATLEKRHVRLLRDDRLVFDYVAKSGRRRLQGIVDPLVYETAAELKRRRGGGRAFLAYRDDRWVDVRSGDINLFIKELAGPDFSAKDFRTWHGTVLAAVGLGISTHAASKTARKRAISRAIQEVAQYLGNTPAVCRSSYIDPRVVDRYLAGQTITAVLESLRWPLEPDAPATQGPIEEAVLDLLDGTRA